MKMVAPELRTLVAALLGAGVVLNSGVCAPLRVAAPLPLFNQFAKRTASEKGTPPWSASSIVQYGPARSA
jgi:hypothetical protein